MGDQAKAWTDIGKEKEMGKLKIAQYFGDKPNNGDYDNGVWQDVLGIPYLQYIDEAKDYDVIVRTLWIESTVQGWSKEIRSRYPHVKQIGLSDHPLSTHISKLPADQQIRYINDLQHLDGIMALTEEERSWYQIAAPSKPVIKAGLPFPFESYEKRFGNLRGSQKRFIGLGVGASDNDRNFISSWLVFQRLHLVRPHIQGVFLSIPTQLIPYCSQLADSSHDSVFIHQRTEMAEYYDVLSQCHFVLNMADRNTPGRLQGEAAFFGVPVIGSDRLELQSELFPALTVTPYDLEDAANLALKLIDNPETAEEHTSYAYDHLKQYNYARTKRRFNKLLKEIESRG
jgi:glycosyltransferase involved in cell wall biosynthesis